MNLVKLYCLSVAFFFALLNPVLSEAEKSKKGSAQEAKKSKKGKKQRSQPNRNAQARPSTQTDPSLPAIRNAPPVRPDGRRVSNGGKGRICLRGRSGLGIPIGLGPLFLPFFGFLCFLGRTLFRLFRLRKDWVQEGKKERNRKTI